MATTQVHFSSLDYFFFAILLVVCIAIGLYFAFKTNNKFSIEEYLFGGKNLSVLPVSLSLAATTISGSATIGQSMEMYAYGLHNWMVVGISFIWLPIMHFVFLPVFYELQLMSTFMYLEMRFDTSVKHLASTLYVITGLFVIPLTLYVPALTFQEVTGINLYVITVTLGLMCTWYTACGGIRAVIWADVFQFFLLTGSVITIMVVGLISVGGVGNVWKALDRGGRLTLFRTELDLEARGTIWSYLTSNVIVYLYLFGMSQSSIQRFISLPSIKKAKIALWLHCMLGDSLVWIQLLIGGIIYTTYETCDPLTTGVVDKIDQIFPHFVQEKGSLFKGFNGIFTAGVAAAGLSTASTFLNTISGTIYNDFLEKRLQKKSKKTFGRVMKTIVAVVGILSIIMVFLIERMGTIFAITNQCFTLSTVGVFGLFVNGMLFKNINSKGAKCGVIVSMIVIGILIIGSINKKPDPGLPLRTDGCNFKNSSSNIFESTDILENLSFNEDTPFIFRINFQFFCIIGVIINISVAYFVSILTGGNVIKDQRLLVTFIRKNVPEEDQTNML